MRETVSSNGRAVHRIKKPDQWNEDAESTHNPHCFFSIFIHTKKGRDPHDGITQD